MSLFFEILSAINNPNQRGSVEQLSAAMNALQEIGKRESVHSSSLQGVMTILGNSIRPILQQQRQVQGSQQVNNWVNQFSGIHLSQIHLNAEILQSTLQSLFPSQSQQQLVQRIASETELSAHTIQSILPELLSVTLAFLSMGASKPGVPGSNSVLNTFLSRNHDTDLGDILKFSNRFLDSS
jgi:hypothetical protein